MQNENKLGHNKPPKFKELPVEISSLKNNQGRITLKNSIIKILKRFEYVEPNKDRKQAKHYKRQKTKYIMIIKDKKHEKTL